MMCVGDIRRCIKIHPPVFTFLAGGKVVWCIVMGEVIKKLKLEGRAMLAMTTIIAISSSAPTISESKEEEKVMVLLNEWEEYLPSVMELKDLIKYIDIFTLPAFHHLYFGGSEALKFSTDNKMKRIKTRVKNSRNSFSAMKKIIFYLEKYLKQLEHMKHFILETNKDLLDSTLSIRLFIIKEFENKLRLVLVEISENIELKKKENINVRSKNSKNIPLFRFNANGDFSYMIAKDIYFFIHIKEFLLYCVEQLHQKKRYEQEQKKRFNYNTHL